MSLDDIPLLEDDRLLLLWIPAAEDVGRLAARLPQGLLVAMGAEDDVRAGRRASSQVGNIMFVHGTTDEIPWRDGMFTVIVSADEPTREVHRVLAPGGAIHRVRR